MHLVLVLTQGSLNSKLLSLRGLPRYLYSPSCLEGMFSETQEHEGIKNGRGVENPDRKVGLDLTGGGK